jgi:hypothetical protein
MKTAFLYDATIKTAGADEPLHEIVAYRGVDQARLALSAHFRVPISDVKIKLQRTPGGSPIEILCETTAEEDGEPCWAPITPLSRIRCGNKARPGFHTCKIHTSFTAPHPVDTPEYAKWAEQPLEDDDDDDDEPARPRRRRAKTTRAAAKGTTPKTPPKPAKPRSDARRRRLDSPTADD